MPSAKSMTSEGRNPPAPGRNPPTPQRVRARPRRPPRRAPPPCPADRSGAQAGAGARSADTRAAPAVLRPLPFPDPGGRRWGTGGTQEAPARVLLITGRSSRLVEFVFQVVAHFSPRPHPHHPHVFEAFTPRVYPPTCLKMTIYNTPSPQLETAQGFCKPLDACHMSLLPLSAGGDRT